MSQVENTLYDGESAPAREVNGIATIVVRVLTLAMLVLGVNQTFNLGSVFDFTLLLN